MQHDCIHHAGLKGSFYFITVNISGKFIERRIQTWLRYKMELFAIIVYGFPINTPRLFHVETTWNTRGVFVGFQLVTAKNHTYMGSEIVSGVVC